MNERTQQLAEQAGFVLWKDDSGNPGDIIDWSSSYDNELKKFAELIVRECLDIASEVRGEPATDTHYVIGYDRACEKMISGIKEHFGINTRT